MTRQDEVAERLYDELWDLVGPGATLAAVSKTKVLLTLARVRQKAPDGERDQLAALAREEVIAACRQLDDRALAIEPAWHGEGAAVLALLGLATGYHSAPMHRRREATANALGYEVGTAFKTRSGVRSHVQNAVYAVADKLWERDIQVRAATSATLVEEQRQELSALTVDLLRRYEAYYAMYTPLSALRGDLNTALELRREGDDGPNRFEDYVASSLHAYADFLLAKRDFMERYRGVWIFAQADIEQGVADAIKLIEHFSGLRYREESILRIERAEHQELQPFVQQLEAGPDGALALRRWRDHIVECHCDLSNPSAECRVHRLMRACRFYIHVLDADWYRIVPWHLDQPSNVGLIDVASLYRDVGVSPSAT